MVLNYFGDSFSCLISNGTITLLPSHLFCAAHFAQSYCIVRVAGYNEEPTTSSSKLRYKTDNEEVSPVSRADVAQVCVNALLDPEASNVSFYLSKDTSPKKQSFGDLESDLMP